MQKSDFRDAATKLEASRDTGAQLFCALLRSIGVETRLVCSLQVLPLSVTAAPRTSQRQGPAFTVPQAERHSAINGDDSCEDERQDLSSAAPTRFGPLGRRTMFTRGIQTRMNGTLHSSSVERRSITPPSIVSHIPFPCTQSNISRNKHKPHQRIAVSHILGRGI
jgi:xeroderma pigmentosum group C-complementing protein